MAHCCKLVRSWALAALWSVAAVATALAADVSTGYVQGPGGYYRAIDRSGPYQIDSAGNATLIAGVSSGTQEQDVTESRTLNAATLGAQQVYPLNGQGTFSFNFANLTASGATVSFFQSNNYNAATQAGTWTPISEVNTGNGQTSLTRSVDGQSAIGIEGTRAVRVQVTTAGTGTITLDTNISVRSRLTGLRGPTPPGDNAIGGTAATPLGGTPQTYRLVTSAASLNATLATTGPLRVFGIFACNMTSAGLNNSSPGYIKLYDKASTPAVATDVPRTVRVWMATTCYEYRFGDVGLQFTNGLGFVLSNNNADNSTSGVGADAFQQVTIEYRK